MQYLARKNLFTHKKFAKKNLLFSSLICNSAKFSSGFSISLKAKGLNALGNLCFIHFLANRSFACKMKYGSFRNSLQFELIELIGTILNSFSVPILISHTQKKKTGKKSCNCGIIFYYLVGDQMSTQIQLMRFKVSN